jgi:hypothetical protein
MSQANVNPDLLKERQSATVDVENLTNFIHGGRDREIKNSSKLNFD